jgi:hypothetical protein
MFRLIRKTAALARTSPTFDLSCQENAARWKFIVVYYESIKRDLKRRLIYEYRCDESEESTRLVDTGLVVELEHPKTKTRLIDEKFASVRGECETSIR